MMLAPSVIPSVRELLKPEDFFRSDHQRIFRAILYCAERGAVDPVTVGERFTDSEIAAYAVELATTTPSAANVTSYVEIVRRHAIKRRQIDIGTELVNRGFNCAEPEDIASYGISELSGIMTSLSDKLGDPMDMFGDNALPALKPEWLPPGIAEYAMDQGRVIGIQPEMIAMSCLATIAAALHDDFTIQPKRNEPKWRERACLWIMVIAPPGSTKSAAVKRAMRPLSQINEKLIGKYAAELAKFIPEERVYQLQVRAQEKRRAKDEGFEEDLKAPERPIQNRLIINDVTTEKLGEMLVDNTRGMLYSTDELALWFGLFDAYNKSSAGKDRQYALKAYDGGPTTFDRKGSGTTHVPNWSYSVIGTTQPEKIRQIALDQPDDGLFQRFMAVEVAKAEIMPDFNTPEDEKLAARYEDAIRAIYATTCTGDSTVQLGEEAAAMYEDFSRWIVRMSATDGIGGMILGHISKWRGLWPRLCLVYHAYGCALAGRHPVSTPVAAKTAERVTAFLQRFLLPQALRFYGGTLGQADKVFSLAQLVAAQILGSGLSSITARDIHRGVNAWRTAPDWTRKAAMGLLRDGAWLKEAESGWAVNPAVHAKFADRALMEAARRTDTAARLQELRDMAAGRRAE